FVGAFERGEDRELIHQDARRLANRFLGRHNAIGGDVEHELVEVSTLFNPRAFHGVAHATDRAVGGIQNDAADGVGTVVGQRTHVAGNVAAALLHLDLHFQLAGFGERGNDVIRIDDLNVVGQVDVGSRHHARALATQGQGDFLTVVQLEDHALEVQ